MSVVTRNWKLYRPIPVYGYLPSQCGWKEAAPWYPPGWMDLALSEEAFFYLPVRRVELRAEGDMLARTRLFVHRFGAHPYMFVQHGLSAPLAERELDNVAKWPGVTVVEPNDNVDWEFEITEARIASVAHVKAKEVLKWLTPQVEKAVSMVTAIRETPAEERKWLDILSIHVFTMSFGRTCEIALDPKKEKL